MQQPAARFDERARNSVSLPATAAVAVASCLRASAVAYSGTGMPAPQT